MLRDKLKDKHRNIHTQRERSLNNKMKYTLKKKKKTKYNLVCRVGVTITAFIFYNINPTIRQNYKLLIKL